MSYSMLSLNGNCMHGNTWNELLNKGLYGLTRPNKWVIEEIKNIKGADKSISLDLGCGLGRHLGVLSGVFRLSVGLDISDKAVRETRSGIEKDGVGSNACVIKGRMNNLPFRDEIFGTILAWRCLYLQNLEGILRTIAEIHRVLCPGGQLICSLRSTENTLYHIGKEKGKQIEKNTFYFPDRDFCKATYHFFTRNEIFQLFHGFKIENLHNTPLKHTPFTVNQSKRANDFWVFTARKR